MFKKKEKKVYQTIVKKKLQSKKKSGNCITQRCCKFSFGKNKSLRRKWWTCHTSKNVKKQKIHQMYHVLSLKIQIIVIEEIVVLQDILIKKEFHILVELDKDNVD